MLSVSEVLKKISFKELYQNEVEAMQKTQESLLARLVHMDQILDLGQKTAARKKPAAYENIRGKIAQFSRLNARLIQGVSSHFAERSLKEKKTKPIHIRKKPVF